jgi:hypothetical protein
VVWKKDTEKKRQEKTKEKKQDEKQKIIRKRGEEEWDRKVDGEGETGFRRRSRIKYSCTW